MIIRGGKKFKNREEFLHYLQMYNNAKKGSCNISESSVNGLFWSDFYYFVTSKRKDEARKLLIPIQKQKQAWHKMREEFISVKVREIDNEIEKHELQIKKTQCAIGILKASKKSYIEEARREFDSKKPFLREKERQTLINIINR